MWQIMNGLVDEVGIVYFKGSIGRDKFLAF